MKRLTSVRRAGFTIVEILVVLSIIILLAGLLLPALVGAKNSANKAQVRNFIKSLMVSLENYVNETGEMPRADEQLTAADSAEVLYQALTYEGGNFEPFPFAESQLKDTDGDGEWEVVDRWGEPLRYFRRFSSEKIKNRPIIISAGPNGTHEDADDITSWQ